MSLAVMECRRCGFPIDGMDVDGICEVCAETMPPAKPKAGPFTLRPYQVECIDRTFEMFASYPSTLIVKATGLGKTVTFAEIINRWEGRVIVMAHRDELIQQACKKIQAITGEECDIEMGENRADRSTMYTPRKVIVTSVQTMSREKRLRRFRPHDFSLMVVDEAHHAAAPSYLAVIEHFRQNTELKLLGVTATPDRADERALGQVFQSVAYEYGIVDGINDGYLVPIDQQFVHIAGLDLSRCRTTAGDLNQKDLARIMEEEEKCHEVASAILQAADGPTLVFSASVRQAEMISDILNRHETGSAEWICGDAVKCPIDMRRDTLKRFSRGAFQFLVNCAVLLEGYDEPTVKTIAMARPTKSRSLYAQVIGRGTRSLPGVIEPHDTAEGRREAIAASGKPSLLVLDFVGNSGRHKLVHTGDILGGNYDDDVIAKATQEVQSASTRGERLDMLKALRAAEEAIKAEEKKRRERVVADAKIRLRSIDPFDVFDMRAKREPEYSKGRPPAPWMMKILTKAKIPTEHLSYSEAEQLAKETIRRWNANLCSFKQAATLRKFGFTTADQMTFDQAREWLDKIAKSGWKLRAPEGF